MRTHLIVINKTDETRFQDMGIRHLTGEMRNFAIPALLGHNDLDEDIRFRPEQYTSWLVDAADVPSMVEYVTQNFPGEEVSVYQLQSIHFREVSPEIRTKEISKNGVLPA